MPTRLPRPLTHLLLDFDETLTTHDTISHLTQTAYRLRSPSLPSLPPWSYFTTCYLSSLPPPPPPSTPTRSLPQHLAYLSSCRPAELASLSRIASHGVFSSLDPSALSPEPDCIRFRPGFWRDLVAPAIAQGVKVTIVSVNWSSTWIRECLRLGAADEGGDVEEVRKVAVRCNELEVVGGLTTGEWIGEKVVVWEDKVRVLKEVRGEDEGLVVYVGDSETDLGPMVEADVGCLVGDELDGLLEELGVNVLPGKEIEGLEELVRTNKGEKMLVKVSSMTELGKLLGFEGQM